MRFKEISRYVSHLGTGRSRGKENQHKNGASISGNTMMNWTSSNNSCESADTGQKGHCF